MIQTEDFEEMANKGITEVTLKADVYNAFADSFYPKEIINNTINPHQSKDIRSIVTVSGSIQVHKEQ